MKLAMPPRGAFCSHSRMRLKKCSESCAAWLHSRSLCTLYCPDCGFEWSRFEGVYG